MIGVYIPGNSLLHRLPAGLKILALMATIITVAMVVRTPMAAGIALAAKEFLFRYMLAVAKRVKSSMLVANAWHARSDAASSLVVTTICSEGPPAWLAIRCA